MRKAINALVLEDKKILLVKKNQTWILLGGKPKDNESDIECLCREVREELSGTELKNIRYYGEFEGITPHKKDNLKAIVYFADIKGRLNIPSAEIKDFAWVRDLKDYNVSDITSKIINNLKKDNYL